MGPIDVAPKPEVDSGGDDIRIVVPVQSLQGRESLFPLPRDVVVIPLWKSTVTYTSLVILKECV